MSDESSITSTRLELHLDQVRKDIDTLLKIVRDGNGSAALVNRVQSIEKDVMHMASQGTDMKSELERLKNQNEEANRNLVAVTHSLDTLGSEIKRFIRETQADKQQADKNRVKRSELVWGAIIAVAVSVASTRIGQHIAPPPKLESPPHESRPK